MTNFEYTEPPIVFYGGLEASSREWVIGIKTIVLNVSYYDTPFGQCCYNSVLVEVTVDGEKDNFYYKQFGLDNQEDIEFEVDRVNGEIINICNTLDAKRHLVAINYAFQYQDYFLEGLEDCIDDGVEEDYETRGK